MEYLRNQITRIKNSRLLAKNHCFFSNDNQSKPRAAYLQTLSTGLNILLSLMRVKEKVNNKSITFINTFL